MNSGGELKIVSLEDIIPYFIEFPKDDFCKIFDGIIYCYCYPSNISVQNLDIVQFKKIISMVLKSPVDLIEYRFINLKPNIHRQVSIGSSPQCEVHIEHSTVSERHAVINIESNTEIWLTDLKSRFGTILNDRIIFPDIKTPIKINDCVTFGLVRTYLKSSSWLYSSITTRFARQLQNPFERIVIRYLNGTIRKRVVSDINIEIDRITLKNVLTGRLEHHSTDDLKAVFWVKNLIGDPSRVDRQGFIKEADPENIFIEFKDGECQWGSHSGYSNRTHGFYFYPHDPDSNNIKCYIPRSALNYVLF